MLNVMRNNLKHLKWVLWIVALSMLLYLGVFFEGNSRGGANEWAARVDGVTISSEMFLNTAHRQDDYYRQLFGDKYEQLKSQLKLGSQVIHGMVNERIMLSEAEKLGLEGSPEEVSRRILADPSFKDASGQFIGKERYAQLIARNVRGGVRSFEEGLADQLAIEKWKALVTEAAAVSDDEVERLYRARSEKTAIDYVVVPLATATFDHTIPQAEVAAYFARHGDRYRRGEGKRIRFVLLDRQAQVSKVQVSDEDVRSFYQSNQEEFQRPDQRRASQILFRVPKNASDADRRSIRDLAESVLKRLKAGEDFASLARSMSQDTASAQKGGDTGWFSRGNAPGPFEQAVFGTPVGEFSPVIETELGFHIVKVTGTRPPGPAPFEEVAEFLRKQLELRRAQDSMKAEADRVRGEISTPADLDAVAQKEKLKVEERLVTREDPAADLGPSPQFNESIARLAPGEVSAPLAVARGLVIATVAEVVPASLPPLSEVTEAVRTDLLNERAQQAAVAAGRRALATSKDFAAAVQALKQTVKSSGDLAPGQGLPGLGSSPALEEALFGPGAALGAKGAIPVASGALVYSVTRRESFDPGRFQADKGSLRSEILEQRRNALLQSVLEAVRSSHDVQINEEVVNRLNS